MSLRQTVFFPDQQVAWVFKRYCQPEADYDKIPFACSLAGFLEKQLEGYWGVVQW